MGTGRVQVKGQRTRPSHLLELEIRILLVLAVSPTSVALGELVLQLSVEHFSAITLFLTL